MLKQIVNACQYLLNNYQGASEVKEYIDNRLSKDAQKEFEIGYFPNAKNLNILTNMFNEKQLIRSKLFNIRYSDGERVLGSPMENHNMIMPYKNTYGKIIGVVGRTILLEEERKVLGISKYKNTEFHKANYLFGLDKAKNAIIENNCVFIVEGQFDCIRAMVNGIKNCVCLGSGSLSFNQFAILARYTDNIILLLDNDEAGIIGANKAISNYGNKINIVSELIPKEYKDLDKFLLSDNAGAKEYLSNIIKKYK